VKYRTLESFRSDFDRLPAPHRAMFLDLLRTHFLPAIAADSFTGSPPWPKRLRVHRLSNSEIYSLTWNFSSPDGRATFHLDKVPDGEPILVWRRIGDHGIYRQP
jgi:hypothetical protein